MVRHQGPLSVEDLVSYLVGTINNNHLEAKDDRLIRLFQDEKKHLRSALGTKTSKWGDVASCFRAHTVRPHGTEISMITI